MDITNYSQIFKTTPHPKSLINKVNEDLLLKDILKREHGNFSQNDILKSLSNSLEKILHIDDLATISEEILKIEKYLNAISENDFFESLDIPKLDRLYISLSPILLQTISEFPNDSEEILNNLEESLRITIEQEIYSLRESIIPE